MFSPALASVAHGRMEIAAGLPFFLIAVGSWIGQRFE